MISVTAVAPRPLWHDIYYGHVLVPSEGIWQSNSQQLLLYTSQVNKCIFVINIFYELSI